MPHIKCTHGTHHMTGHEATEYRELTCACKFVWGNKDPAKMMHATMALVERGLDAKPAHAICVARGVFLTRARCISL